MSTEERELLPWSWVILGMAGALTVVVALLWILWSFVGSMGVFLPLVGTLWLVAVIAVFLIDGSGARDEA